MANAGITLGCRRSGASEEDQRLRLCALRPARRCHQRHEGAQWKGLLPCRHSRHQKKILTFSFIQMVDGSPIEVTLAKPVDKDSYVRYTRGTGGRGGSLQTDYATYSVGQVRRCFTTL